MKERIKEVKEMAKASGLDINALALDYKIRANMFKHICKFLTENDGALRDYIPDYYNDGVMYQAIYELEIFAEYNNDVAMELMK